MGILSITPSYEFAAHGLLPHGTTVIQDPHPLAGNHTGPRDGPRTSHFIWDAATGGAPLFPDVERERLSQQARADSRNSAQYQADRAQDQADRVAERERRAAGRARAREWMRQYEERLARQQRNRDRVRRGLGAFARGVIRARN